MKLGDHENSSTCNYVRNQIFHSFVNGFYERRSFATNPALTTRKRGVCERPYHPEHHSEEILDYEDFALRPTLAHFSLQHENGVGGRRVRESNQVCYRSTMSYNSKTGGLGHRGNSTIAIFVESLQLDNGG